MDYLIKETIDDMHPTDLVKIIDSKFFEAKKAKLSRYDTAWGSWSREMNVSIRERIGLNLEPDYIIEGLKYVFIYWITVSNILEMFNTFGSLLHFGKRKKFEREAMNIKTIIIKESYGKLKNMGFTDLADVFLGGRA